MARKDNIKKKDGEAKKPDRLKTTAIVLMVVFATLIFALFIWAASSSFTGYISSDSQSSSDSEKPKHKEPEYLWYGVDSLDEVKTTSSPKSDFYYYVSEASGNPNLGIGHITGVIRNSKKNLSSLKITFATYSGDGIKITTCSDSIASLGMGELWNFNAICDGWGSGETYKIESIDYE